jgi:nucleoside-diphosphate-sugar epimerase
MTDGSGWASAHMKCLVTGAYGFIGGEVAAALRREGATVIGCGRDLELARRVNPAIEWIACNFNTDVTPAHWKPRLAGIDVVVNCVGILQGNLRDDAEASMPTRLLLCSRRQRLQGFAASCISPQ